MSTDLAYVNPKILKKVREDYGFSLEKASKHVLSSEKLERVEEGQDYLTFNQLKKLANRYGLPITYFYLNEENVEKTEEKFRSVRSQNIPLSPKLQEIINIVHNKRDVTIEFSKYDPNEYDYSFIDSISITDTIEESAKKIIKYFNISELRKQWKNEYDVLNSWINEFTRQGILVFQHSFNSEEIIRGLSISKKPYPVIVLNKKDAVLGRVFSLLHELVHLTLKDDEELSFGIKVEQTPIEAFCNKVTAEILMPEKEFLISKVILNHLKDNDFTNDEIKKLHREFWVSEEAILNRLNSMKLLTRKNYKSEFDRIKREEKIKLEKKKEKLDEKDRKGGQSPVNKVISGNSKTFLNIILTAYEEKEYNSGKLSRLLNLKLKHLDKLYEDDNLIFLK